MTLSQGCQTVSAITPSHHKKTAAEIDKILVVNSNSHVERYRIAEQAFAESIQGTSYNIIDLMNEDDPVGLLQDVLNHGQFEHIYCIGAKALGSIDYIAPEQDIVFSSVLNWQRFQGQEGISGIASDIAPTSQLAMFKHFFPELTSVGVIYSDTNKARIKQAVSAAESLGITLHPVQMEDNDDIDHHIQFLSDQVQALWLIPDPVVLSSIHTTTQIFELAHQDKLPIFSSNSLFKDLGATLVVSADLPTIGRQAAILIKNTQQHETQVHYPAGSHIILNMNRTMEYQLELNYQALGSVNELIE
ncbi:ABC transporter substrate-binding protein [Litoribrevibacter euphylliae]|uniref:ABC transporter substrate-binding protein n=1 Tax=Litoribrevibacter euphylliae TaxID=1834034 RepID=A0ABV7HHE0_9GAMM